MSVSTEFAIYRLFLLNRSYHMIEIQEISCQLSCKAIVVKRHDCRRGLAWLGFDNSY
jgi:hypothetical protein